jgi:DNA repair protein RadC
MYPTPRERLQLVGLGATRSKRAVASANRRACASDVLPHAWLRLIPCIEYPSESLLATLPPVTTSIVAAQLLRSVIPADVRMQEHFAVLLLDAKNRALGIDLLFAGGVDGAQIDRKLVFQAAILLAATGLILAHNHPSGNSAPSPEDLSLTHAIVKGGETVGVRVFDHIILGEANSHFSMLDAGLMRT